MGSKKKLAKKIIEKITPHKCYIEVFAGAANVFFQKKPSKVEVINDINHELITLYRVLQNHLEEFFRYLKWALVSREEFQRQMKSLPETLTDIQRAVRFYYIQRCSFAGKTFGRTFGYSLTTPPKMNLLRIEEELSEIHLRLSRVLIECLPYDDILKRYDRPDSFFYLDPPYEGCEKYYGKNVFSKDDFENLAEILKNIKGNFVLSLNDSPNIRRIFKEFKIEEASIGYQVNPKKVKVSTEVLITK